MKKIAVLILVVALLALSVVPAFAAGGPPANRGTGTGTCTGNQTGLAAGSQYRVAGLQAGFGIRNPYALSGTIVSVDLQAETVTVAVVCGNRLLESYIGTNVTLLTSDITRILQRNEDGIATPITLADLVPGENVSSHGSLVEGVFTANRVTQGAELNCIQ